MVTKCLQDHNLKEALQLFDRHPSSRDVVSWNLMIRGLTENRELIHAHMLFDEMPQRNVDSWNAILSGYYRARDPSQVFRLLREMGRSGCAPNECTISMVLTAFLGTKFSSLVPQIHAHVFQLGLESSSAMASTLISGYMDINCVEAAERAFLMMPTKNSISWTNLLHGYIVNGCIDKARSMFDMARESERNVFLWTVMINGYVKSRKYREAMMLFTAMVNSRAVPNHFTYSCVLSACALTSSLLLGQQVHARVVKFGMPDSVVLLTSLTDMYAKCGDIKGANQVFQNMQYKNTASWNAIIGGLARHGLGTVALETFDCMIENGFLPDKVTFVNVLYACVHGGLVCEGEAFFKSMKVQHGIEAELEHYACMVDLYGKVGELEKAERLIKEMPIKPDVVVWGAFIGACAVHSNQKLSGFAVEGIERLKKDHPAVYTMALKVHAEEGSWSRVMELKRIIGTKRVEKQKACSRIETP